MTKRESNELWNERLVAQAGKAMRQARRRTGGTASDLSDETAAIGLRLSPTVIAKLDSGHRGSVLNVTELLVMAAALNMPPALLLFPGYPDGEVEYLPGRRASSKAVVEWYCGQTRMPGEGSASNPGIEIVDAVRQRDAAVADLALPPSNDLPKEANKQVRQKRLDRMLDALQRITDLQKTLGEEN